MIILAPHPDDELIGCFSALSSGAVTKVIYFMDHHYSVRNSEVKACAKHFGFEAVTVDGNDPSISWSDFAEQHRFQKHLVLMPNINDSHPHHKWVNRTFRFLCPSKRFYSVDLDRALTKTVLTNAQSKVKLDSLNTLYPSQRSLWESNASYYLFESIVDRDYHKQFYVKVGSFEVWSDVYVTAQELSAWDGEEILDYLISKGATKVEVLAEGTRWSL